MKGLVKCMDLKLKLKQMIDKKVYKINEYQRDLLCQGYPSVAHLNWIRLISNFVTGSARIS